MSGASVIAAARKVREHWRAQDGINGAVIDELCDAVDTIGTSEMLAIPASDLFGDVREALRTALMVGHVGLVDLNVHDDDPSASRLEERRFENVLRSLSKSVVRTLQMRSGAP